MFLLIFVAAATTFFSGAPSAWAETTCTGVMNGATPSTIPGFSGLNALSTLNGNVTVPSGASCTLMFYNVTGNVQAKDDANLTLVYVNVSGNVQVQNGGTLVINAYNEPSTVGGNVQANQCKSALLQGNVTVGGNLQIQQCTGAGPNGFQGPGIVINGNFQCKANASNATPCLAWLGKVHGDVQIQSNVAPTAPDVSLVTVGGNLQCQHDSLPTTHLHGPSWVDGNSQDECAGFATTSTSISSGAVAPAASCEALAALPAAGFPVPSTVIVSATATPASGTLPARCIVVGFINDRISMVDSCEYQDRFQVALPVPAAWNGRLFMEGGGGTEGSVPAPTGADSGSGSAASNFGIVNGYAVATQDGGHENSQQKACPNGYGNVNEFYLDPGGLIAKAYQSVQVTVLTAKYLINEYYGTGPGHSYWVGCSDGGGRGMAMSQNFPEYLDGIVAGDPGGNLQELELGSGVWDEEQLLNVYNTAVPPLPALAYASEPTPEAAEPIVYPAFPSSDQALFETALLQACDALDGVADGVVDNVPACVARFNPAAASYIDYAGALGPANTSYPLQCPGAKNATCLSPAQIQAAIAINQGPRTTAGMTIKYPEGAAVPDHPDNTIPGFAYDGGWMTTQGIPSIAIGTPTTPGANLHLSGFGYQGLSLPNPGINALTFNFNSPSDLATLSSSSPDENASTSLDISKFIKYGHKIIWYHGLSDPRVPVVGMIRYYNDLASQNGGLQAIQNFSRFYPVPNLGHCTGGATTDQFDMLTPVVNWVENGTPPGPITATGVNFNATTYQVVGNYITGAPVNAPTQRSRPLCPYPQQARFTGGTTLMNGLSVVINPADLANASNYVCIQPPLDHDRDHDHDHDHDHDRGH
jgi:feruloyl esterase